MFTNPDQPDRLPPEAEAGVEHNRDTAPQTALLRLADYQPLAAFFLEHYGNRKLYVQDARAEGFFKEHQGDLMAGIAQLLEKDQKANSIRSAEQVQTVAYEFANSIKSWLWNVGLGDANDLPRGYAYRSKEVYNEKTHKYEPGPGPRELFLIGTLFQGRKQDDAQLTGHINRVTGESWGESADGMRGAGSSTWHVDLPDTFEAIRLLEDIREGLLDDFTRYVEERQTGDIDKVVSGLRQRWDKTPGEGDPTGQAWHKVTRSGKLEEKYFDPEQKALFAGVIRNYEDEVAREVSLMVSGDWQTFKRRAGRFTPGFIERLKTLFKYNKEEYEASEYVESKHGYFPPASPEIRHGLGPSTDSIYQAFRATPNDFEEVLKGKIPPEQVRKLAEREKTEFYKRRAHDFWSWVEHGSPGSVPETESPLLQLRSEVETMVSEKLTPENYLSTGLSPEEFKKWGLEWLKAKDILEGKGGYNMPGQPADFSEAQKILEQLKTLLGSRQEKVNPELQNTIERMRKGKFGLSDSIKITAQNGGIAEVVTFTDRIENIRKVPLAQGWGKLSLGRGKNKVYTSHDGKYVYVLPDNGTILMDGKGQRAIVVKKDGDSLIAQSELTMYRVGEEPNTFFAEADPRTVTDYQSGRTGTDRGGASLADAFKKSGESGQTSAVMSEQPAKDRKPTVAKPATEKPVRVLHPAEGKQHMTPEARQALTDDFAFVNTLIANMKASNLKLPDALQDKIRELKTELAQTPEGSRANPASLLGTIRAIRASIESQYKPQASKIANKGWIKTYEDLWKQAGQVIKENADAQEFINAGIATEEVVLQKVRAKLTAGLANIQNGDQVNMENMLNETLGEF